MLSFAKLWVLLNKRGLKKTDLLEIISAPTLAKLSKNENINSSIIEKICEYLNCQPGDIMEYVNKERMIDNAKYLDTVQLEAIENLKNQGYTEDDLRNMAKSFLEEYVNAIFSGGTPISDTLDKIISDDSEEGAT